MSLLETLLQNHTSPVDRLMQVLPYLNTPGGAKRPTTDMSSFTSGGENPWGIDPNGMDLVTRHGVTLDQDAMQSLIAAKRAGYNPFPYIGGGYRSPEASQALYDARHDASGNLLPGVLPAAPAGQSMHNYGLAFDAGGLPEAVRSYLIQNGWYWGNSFGDAPHYSYGRSG